MVDWFLLSSMDLNCCFTVFLCFYCCLLIWSLGFIVWKRLCLIDVWLMFYLRQSCRSSFMWLNSWGRMRLNSWWQTLRRLTLRLHEPHWRLELLSSFWALYSRQLQGLRLRQWLWQARPYLIAVVFNASQKNTDTNTNTHYNVTPNSITYINECKLYIGYYN